MGVTAGKNRSVDVLGLNTKQSCKCNEMNDAKIYLDKLLIEYRVQPVGLGYAECIIKKDDVIKFIDELSELSVGVEGISWWCHCTDNNKKLFGCPHGGGGPPSIYYEGYFSEMYHVKKAYVSRRDEILRYIYFGILSDKFYSPCIEPALWLKDNK